MQDFDMQSSSCIRSMGCCSTWKLHQGRILASLAEGSRHFLNQLEKHSNPLPASRASCWERERCFFTGFCLDLFSSPSLLPLSHFNSLSFFFSFSPPSLPQFRPLFSDPLFSFSLSLSFFCSYLTSVHRAKSSREMFTEPMIKIKVFCAICQHEWNHECLIFLSKSEKRHIPENYQKILMIQMKT